MKLLKILIIAFFLVSGTSLLWAMTLPIPDFNSYIENINQAESTKIYDRTGEVLLWDLHGEVKRTVVPYENISKYVRDGFVAIEDDTFYQHKGISPTAILRAVFKDIISGSAKQGGSTITQQVVKNALLSKEKTISRKVKEWILAVKLEKELDKKQILTLYLNEIPFGGMMYGIEEASQAFFKKSASELTLPESAYLAAIPQAPSRYSPYGNHRDELEARKNLVLDKMAGLGYISKEEAQKAKKEVVEFAKPEGKGLKAPHFVFYIKDILEEKYGKDAVEKGGLKVISSLDWKLQEKAETIVAQYAADNEKNFNARNASLVAIDPKTGQILVMVGSRDYYDTSNDGNFNIALAKRQPGSSFKPIVYSTAFEKGYTPDTVLFDLPTEFNVNCDAGGTPGAKPAGCYMPVNYDDKFVGPISLRNALAQSRNIPAVKLLYLAGIDSSLDMAKRLGITTLADKTRYGLTLVLGGGEVSLLELTSAYSVFANDGVRNPYAAIIKVEDSKGKVLEEFKQQDQQVMDSNIARQISSILSDESARIPAYGARSPLYFADRQVAAKTGTTNDFRDTWIIGYSPNIAVGAWAGNNDNSPIAKKVAGMVVAPMWSAFMKEALATLPNESFGDYSSADSSVKPVLRGHWQGNQTYVIDKISGGLATEYTPASQREERSVTSVHSILFWVNKSDPLGPAPSNPYNDGQFKNWEHPIRQWAIGRGYTDQTSSIIPKNYDNIHQPGNSPTIKVNLVDSDGSYTAEDKVVVRADVNQNKYSITKVEFYVNGVNIGSANRSPYQYSFSPSEIKNITKTNEIKAVVYDSAGQKAESRISFFYQK